MERLAFYFTFYLFVLSAAVTKSPTGRYINK